MIFNKNNNCNDKYYIISNQEVMVVHCKNKLSDKMPRRCSVGPNHCRYMTIDYRYYILYMDRLYIIDGIL